MPNYQDAFRAGQLRSFHRLAAGDLAGALARRSPVDREALSAALRSYHRRVLGLRDSTEAALRALAEPGSLAVVAGQQPGLLGGPAYSVHKAVDAVLLARKLDRPGRRVVPVFWVASQDHDQEEIASARLLDFSERLIQIRLPLPPRRPSGRMQLQPSWVETVRRELSGFSTSPAFLKLGLGGVEEAAAGAATFSDWFTRWLYGLLAEQGLLMVDPMQPELASRMVPGLLRELADPLAGPESIERAAVELQALGFPPQLRRQEGATNLFLELRSGERQLLRYQEDRFLADRSYSAGELAALLAEDPTRITPGAGLRPVLQDYLLPTAALILGPGELGYLLELAGVYALHRLEQPLLWPRLQVTWAEPVVSRLLGRYQLQPSDLEGNVQAVGERLALERSGLRAEFAERAARLEVDIAELQSALIRAEPSLSRAAQRSVHRMQGQVQRLQHLVSREALRRDDQLRSDLDRLRLHLMPGGVRQERSLSFLTFLLKYGPQPLEKLLSLPPGAQSVVALD